MYCAHLKDANHMPAIAESTLRFRLGFGRSARDLCNRPGGADTVQLFLVLGDTRYPLSRVPSTLLHESTTDRQSCRAVAYGRAAEESGCRTGSSGPCHVTAQHDHVQVVLSPGAIWHYMVCLISALSSPIVATLRTQ